MKKIKKFLAIYVICALVLFCVGLLSDRITLNDELIRFHVIANSDSVEDQNIKIKVKDAVNNYLKVSMQNITNMEDARNYLKNNIGKIQEIANQVLAEYGTDTTAIVTFCKESFETRVYDTFRLPAGWYESLKISIGNGEGKNWWCVVYPMLCYATHTGEFETIAVDAGFSDKLSSALTDDSIEIRFYLLDLLGRLENKFRH